MARTPQRMSATKQAERLKALARQKRMLNFKRENAVPVIPQQVLQKLASLNLPPNKWVYDVCLRELLSPSGGLPAVMRAMPRQPETTKEGMNVRLPGFK